MMRFLLLLVLAGGFGVAVLRAQSNAIIPVVAPTNTAPAYAPPPALVEPAKSAPAKTVSAKSTSSSGGGKSSSTKAARAQTAEELQAALDRLSQSNRDLLDLLKTQQAVLEDIQYDRRLQSRQIQSLEERLTESQIENAQLQGKVDTLEAEAVTRNAAPSAPTLEVKPSADTNVAPTNDVAADTNAAPATPEAPPPPQEPESVLPPPSDEPVGGSNKTWHRLFTLKGTDNQNSQMFHVDGQLWRVLWHNEDKPGKMYEKTSALFINAFPKDDTIPQHVCAQLGTAGDGTELQGPGNYYLKIEASGGSWELAVEDLK